MAGAGKMPYNFLGRSGLKVSNICLGTMTFGQTKNGLPGQAEEEEAHRILDRYVELGGNFIDTADVYSNGRSEEIIGTWLAKRGRREEVVLASKVRAGFNMSHVNQEGLSRRHVTQSVEESLARLQTRYLDLYQMHNWDDGTPIEETLRTLDDLVRCGKVRYVGVSNLTGWQLLTVLHTAQTLGLNPVVSLQQQYSLAARETEFEPLQVCRLHGVGVLPWSPLKGGLLTGKYTRDRKPELGQGRVGWVAEDESARGKNSAPPWSKFKDDERFWALLETVKQTAQKHDRSMSQVALRWLLQKPVVSSVVIGARTLDQLEDNMAAAAGWQLSQDEMLELDEASMPVIPYPYDKNFLTNRPRRNPFMPQYNTDNWRPRKGEAFSTVLN